MCKVIVLSKVQPQQYQKLCHKKDENYNILSCVIKTYQRNARL